MEALHSTLVIILDNQRISVVNHSAWEDNGSGYKPLQIARTSALRTIEATRPAPARRIPNPTEVFARISCTINLKPSGKIIRRVPRDVVVRQRRRMKKLARFVVDGTMSIHAFKNQYRAWRGDLKRKYQCYHTVKNMDKLYKELIQWITKMNRWKNKGNVSQSSI